MNCAENSAVPLSLAPSHRTEKYTCPTIVGLPPTLMILSIVPSALAAILRVAPVDWISSRFETTRSDSSGSKIALTCAVAYGSSTAAFLAWRFDLEDVVDGILGFVSAILRLSKWTISART